MQMMLQGSCASLALEGQQDTKTLLHGPSAPCAVLPGLDPVLMALCSQAQPSGAMLAVLCFKWAQWKHLSFPFVEAFPFTSPQI